MKINFNTGTDMAVREKDAPFFMPDWFKSFYQLSGNPNSAEQVAMAPYAKHPWVYACITAITKNISPLQPVLFDKNKPKEPIHDHPVLTLLEMPNPLMTGQEFFEAVLLNLLLPTIVSPGGQCFILPTDAEGNPVDLIRGVMPEFLWPYSDVMVRPHQDGHIFKGWVFKHPCGKEIPFAQDQVIRIKLFNPQNWLLGLSPYSSLQQSVIGDAKANELSDKFKDNNASIGSLLTTERKLTKEQVEALQGIIREQYAGFVNAGKMLLLHSGFKFDQMSKSLSELQHIEGREFTREEIMAVYGVSKLELGLVDSINRATAEVEKELFWMDTLIPLIIKIWNGGLNPQWIRYIDQRNKRGMFDLTRVAALRSNTEGKIKGSLQLIMQGVPPNTAFATMGLQIETDGMDWLDEPLVKGTRTNLRTGETVGQAGAGGGMVEPPPARAPSYTVKTKEIALENREEYWTEFINATQMKPEKDYKRMIVKFWTEQRNEFLDKVDEWKKKKTKAKVQASLSDFMIDKKPQDAKLVKASEPIYQNGIDLQAAKLAEELGELVNYDPTGPTVKRIKRSRRKFLKGVNTQTFKTMGKEINKVLKDNPDATVNQLTKLIKDAQKKTMNGIIASSAKTVARTETSSIASRSRNDIMQGEGIEKHQWISARDELVRESHAEIDGQVVKIGEEFDNGLSYPLETGGEPEEVINCRCTTVAVKE